MQKNMNRMTLAALSLLALSVPVAAEPVRALSEYMLPIQVSDAKGQPAGAAVAMVQSVLATAKIESEVELHPWSYSYERAKNGDNIVIFSMMRTASRERQFHWIGPLITVEPAVILSHKTQQLPSLMPLEAIKQHRVCGNDKSPHYQTLLRQGFTEGKNLLAFDDPVYLSRYSAGQQSVDWRASWLKPMANGQACELRIVLPMVFKHRMGELGLSSDEFNLNYRFGQQPRTLYLAASWAFEPPLLERLRTAYQRLKTEGELSAICRQWLDDPIACRAVAHSVND